MSKTQQNQVSSEVKFDGSVYRWISNGRVPPADAIISHGIDKLPGFSKEAHDLARDAEIDAFLTKYRKRMENWQPSEEDRHEWRAAFGKGATVVNAITGKSYKV